MNTLITIKYADGTVRGYAANDLVEKRIVTGDMFSISTVHPATGDEIVKLYPGNPMNALGRMLMMQQNTKTGMDMSDRENKYLEGFLAGIIDCIKVLAEEFSSGVDKSKLM